jgi:hypothetical protein
MDIKDYLEKAKELLQRDKHLMPVLFVETEDQIFVLGLAMDIGKIDRREMMKHIGRNFANQHKDKRIKSLSFIFEAWVTSVDIHTNLSERVEAVVVSTWDINTNKKEVITQDYEIIDNNVIWKGESQGVEETKAYILEAFIQGYDQILNYANHLNE